MTYEKYDVTDGNLRLFIRIVEGYSCVKGHAPLYTMERLKKLCANNDTEIFVSDHGRIKSCLGVRYDHPDKIRCWARNTIGLRTEDDLRDDIDEWASFLADLIREKGKKGAYVNVKWKQYKPTFRFQFDNWQEIYEEAVSKYFEFEIDPDEKMEWWLK